MHGFECRQNAVRSGIDANGRQVAPADDALRINHEEGASGGPGFGGINAIGLGDSSLGLEVRKQRKSELSILFEREMAPDPIHGNAQELASEALELGQDFIVERHLVATDGAPVGRVEGKDHGASQEFAQGHFLIGGTMKAEFGCAFARGQDPRLGRSRPWRSSPPQRNHGKPLSCDSLLMRIHRQSSNEILRRHKRFYWRPAFQDANPPTEAPFERLLKVTRSAGRKAYMRAMPLRSEALRLRSCSTWE